MLIILSSEANNCFQFFKQLFPNLSFLADKKLLLGSSFFFFFPFLMLKRK